MAASASQRFDLTTPTPRRRTIAESQLRDYQARLGQAFPHEAYLLELTGLRDQLKAKLSAGHNEGNGKGPTTSELAGDIKALKAANTIEAAPQRTERRQTAAEEPITARIRRRQEGHSANNQAGEHDAAMEAADKVRQAEQEESPARPPMTFQERIILERQRNGEGEGQSPG